MIGSEILKTVGLAGFEGLLNLLLQKAEGLADFAEILLFMIETLKRGEVARLLCKFFNMADEMDVFAMVTPKPAVFKMFVFDWEIYFRLCEVYRFQNLAGLELPIKHTLNYNNRGLIFKKLQKNHQ